MRPQTRSCVIALLVGAFFVHNGLTQTLRPGNDPRNQSPAVGTGGPPGGPTGLFTIYDGSVLRRGEFTLSTAYSNYDRDPGNVDITEVPLSFNVGLTDNIELFFKTDAYRGIKVNNPAILSSFYLPNSQLPFGVGLGSIIYGPVGPTAGPLSGQSVFHPAFSQPFVQFPFVGRSAGNFGVSNPGPFFGFPSGVLPSISTPIPGHSTFGAAGFFPGMGSPVGSILPGIVFSTGLLANNPQTIIPLNFTEEPSYLPDAPFVNRLYGESNFTNMVFGSKIRFTGPNNPLGVGVVGYWQLYTNHGTSDSGFDQLQRGAGPGGDIGDFGIIGFLNERLSTHVNVSGNFGFVLTSNPKIDVGNDKIALLDRPNEFLAGIGFDFPINKHFQPIAELKTIRYEGGTPNAFENDPVDVIGGVKIYPRRWWGFGLAYRRHLNQQKDLETPPGSTNVLSETRVANGSNAVAAITSVVVNNNRGLVAGSTNPDGFIFQFFAGRRKIKAPEVPNRPPTIGSVTLSSSTITIPCPPGTRSSAGCPDNTSINVSTRASDPDNDPFTYNYSVTGGRIVGTGPNVTWDVSGLAPGTYTITTSVADGCTACSKSDVETITVTACSDCKAPCTCPTLSVSGPAGVITAGQSMSFTATSSGDVTYNWTVSAGTISSGRGTSSISVDTTGLAPGTSVTATVDISGASLCADCPKTQSATGELAKKIESVLVDEYGKLTNDDVKARIDGFYTQLNNDPTSHGYVIIYGTPAQIKAARAQIDKAIAFRKYDPSRLTVVTGPPQGADVHVKLYMVPAGADNPTP